LKSKEPKEPKVSEHIEISFDATKIALPFADTPIIRRNKEMRKGVDNGRRSSLGNRGRRASSLIDSGKSNGNSSSCPDNFIMLMKILALPHDKVDSSEFYKHIESGLPEPRRMKQLLTWCGTRALMEKPSSTSETYHAGFAGMHHSSLVAAHR
jgi:kinetochore protein Mis13/DSN1